MPPYIFCLLLDKLEDKSDFLYVIYCLEEDSVALALWSIMDGAYRYTYILHTIHYTRRVIFNICIHVCTH